MNSRAPAAAGRPWRQARTLRRTFATLALCALCATVARADTRYATALTYWPERPGGYAGLPLESGQIVLAEAPSAFNLVIALMPEHYRPFVHAGILAFEQGEPYVYEAIGAWGITIGRRPTDAISGAVKRVRLREFLDHNDYVEFYDPPPAVDRSRLLAFARHHHQAETPFDPYFNAYDHRRLYCAEFVALALEDAGSPPLPVSKQRQNHSLAVALDWLGIRAERHYQAADVIAGATPVAALSVRRTLTEARVHFAVRRELHRRFTPDQRLGHIVRKTATGLAVRESVKRFEEAAQTLFPRDALAPPQARADETVRRLADRLFGPLPVAGSDISPPSAERLRPRAPL
jgi:hypothetical protein